MKLSGSESDKQNRQTRRERNGAGLFSMSAGVSFRLLLLLLLLFRRGSVLRTAPRARDARFACSAALGDRARLTSAPRSNSAARSPRPYEIRGQLARLPTSTHSLVAHSPARLARSLTRSTTPSVGKRRALSPLSPGNSGYAATALYNGGRTRNRLAKRASPPLRREDAVVFAQWRRANITRTRGTDELRGR